MNRLMTSVVVLVVLLVGVAIGLTVRLTPGAVMAQGGCQTFKETGKTVCGRFLQYWQQKGGLAQQGYPISSEFTETSDLNGKPYTVQYFERAVFEKHPENQPPYDVLLSQLGTYRLSEKYPDQADANHSLTLGTVSGSLMYPSSGAPPMDVYLVEVGGSRYYVGHNTGLDDPVIRGTAFSISGIAPGKYYLYAYAVDPSTGDASAFALSYTRGVLCDIDPRYSCDDHTLVPVEVKPGANVGNLPVADVWVSTRIVPRYVLAGACETFGATGRTMCGTFLAYWHAHGGLAQQGYPISDEVREVSDLDGKEYVVQYFERAVFEKHPEFGPANYVLLSQLGTFQFKRKYPGGQPGRSDTPPPTPPVVGQVITVQRSDDEKMQITVRSVQETTQLKGRGGYPQYRARGKYVVLFITVTNMSRYGYFGWRDDLRLVDDKRRRYLSVEYGEQQAASDQFFRDPPDTWVEPDKSAEEVLVFDAAPDAANYKLALAQTPNP